MAPSTKPLSPAARLGPLLPLPFLLPLFVAGCSQPTVEEPTATEELEPVTVYETVYDQPADDPGDDADAAEPAQFPVSGGDQAPNKPKPTPDLACQSLENTFEERILDDCDGEWATAHTPSSDDNALFKLAGTHWVPIQPDGHTFTGFPCYDVEYWKGNGAPAFVTDHMMACD